MSGTQPLILTAQLPPELQSRANALRQAHFPPERNFLDAHVTLLHAIPHFCAEELKRTLKQLTAQYGPPPAQLTGVMNLGKGTALRLESPAMLALREAVADSLYGMLTQQDQHTPRLHITIQNKVTGKQAKALQAALTPQIDPENFTFRGFALWRYCDGPWEAAGDYAFRGKAMV